MEIIIELVGTFLIEGSIELIKNKKISKWIRYPLLVILVSLYLLIILGLSILGFKLISEDNMWGILLLLGSLVVLVLFVLSFKKLFSKK